MIRLTAALAVALASSSPLCAQSVATAPINDIPGTAHVVTNVTFPASLTTNDVCNIVTNEVDETDDWQVFVNGEYKQGWSVQFDAFENPDGAPMVDVMVTDNGHAVVYLSTGDAAIRDDPSFNHVVPTGGVVEHGYEYLIGATVFAERKRITRNALGLARLEDIEKLPDAQMVTNVARSVVNSVWDAKLGVAWEARMHNGHLYYIAVTNQPPVIGKEE